MKKRQILAGLLALLLMGLTVGCAASQPAATADSAASTETTSEAEAEAAAEGEETAEDTVITYPAESYLANITAADYVKPADYEKIPVEVVKHEITEEDIEEQIQYALSSSQGLQEVTDRDVVQEGDVANIDYKGMKDGAAFDGGTSAGFDLEIGSGTFIDGFEEGLVGAKVGETVSLNLTFPENYGNAELAGQDVVFEVKVNSIQEHVDPELNDEFVKSLGITDHDGKEVSDVAGLRAYIRHFLEEEAENDRNSTIQSATINYMLENSTYTEPFPQPLQDRLTGTITSMFESYAGMYGMEFNDFLEQVVAEEEGTSADDVLATMVSDYAKQLLLVKAVAEEQGLTLTDEELETEIEELAASAGYEVEEYKKLVDVEALREELLGDKVLELFSERADVTEVDEDHDHEHDHEDEETAEE